MILWILFLDRLVTLKRTVNASKIHSIRVFTFIRMLNYKRRFAGHHRSQERPGISIFLFAEIAEKIRTQFYRYVRDFNQPFNEPFTAALDFM